MAGQIPTLKQCEEALGEPAEKWKGRCFEIACRINDAGLTPGAKPRYGHYWGECHPDGYFGTPTLPPRHGWLELPEGVIFDPTRWVFENVDPYLALVFPDGLERHRAYDVGGERLMSRFDRDIPPSDEELKARGDMWFKEHPEYVFPESTWPLLDAVLGRHENLRRGHLNYLANRGPEFLGEHAEAIYKVFVEKGKQAWIPLDYRHAVLGTGYESFL